MGDEGFKHITVTAAEDDDFVIRAGVAEEPAASQAAPEPEPEPAPAPESEPAAPAKPAANRATTSAERDSYHETTLEDLNSTKMPLAQRIVIIAAIVCIIGAVIYYFAFLR